MNEIQLIYWFFKRFKNEKPVITIDPKSGKYRAGHSGIGIMSYYSGETISDAIRKWYEDETLEGMKG